MENRPPVEIIKDNGHTVSVLICEVALNLSKRCCHINLFSTSDIETVIDDIILTVGGDCCFQTIVSKLNFINTMQIIEVVCPDEFCSKWLAYCESMRNNISLRDAVLRWFGIKTHIESNKHKLTLFQIMMVDWANVFKSKRGRWFEKENSKIVNNYSSGKYFVSHINNISNIAQYRINNEIIEICLVGRAKTINAKTVCEMVIKLESAFLDNNCSAVKEVIAIIGGVATFRLINSFFVEESNNFFSAQLSQCIQMRCKPQPRTLLNSYFGGSLAKCEYELLLQHMESKLNFIYQELISGNKMELEKENTNWSLFVRSKNGISNTIISFDDISPQLRPEYRRYLRDVFNPSKINYNDIKTAKAIYAIYNYSKCALRNVYEVSPSLSSLSHLNRTIVIGVLAQLSQHTIYALAYQRMILLHLRKMYYYICGNVRPTNVDPFYRITIPQSALNPTIPISKEFAAKLLAEKEFFSPEIHLAIKVAIETGARGESICELTTDDIIPTNSDKCIANIFNSKRASRTDLNEIHPFVAHELSSETSRELLTFIDKTADIRAELQMNYIFVYYSTFYRKTSLRRVMRLKADVIDRALQAYAKAVGYCDEHCNSLPCSLRSIRAAVGRAEFQAGKTPQQVADKLGNTPTIASAHYHHMTATEKAKKYNTLYNNQLLKIIDSDNKRISDIPLSRKTMYGTCDATVCNADAKDCANCSARINCRTKEVNTNE